MLQTSSLPEAFAWPVRVYIEDTDAGGIVYYVNYLKFMERARTEFLRSLGSRHLLLAERDVQFVVHSCEVRYLRPARIDDALQVTARVARLGRAGIRFHQQVRRGDEVLCEAQVQVACVSAATLQPRALPSELRAAMAAASAPESS